MDRDGLFISMCLDGGDILKVPLINFDFLYGVSSEQIDEFK